MSRRKHSEHNVRKLFVTGDSIAVTLPVELIDKLKWRKKQKVVVKQRGKSILITDKK